MSKEIVPQNQELRKAAIAMVIRGQVTRNGRADQCFISTDDDLYLANATACTCSGQPCAHTIAASLYTWARHAVETILERHPILSIEQVSWLLEDGLQATTNPDVADRLEIGLAVCRQLHCEMINAWKAEPRFQSSYTVSLTGLTRADGVRMTRGFS